jgi:hexokinase
MALHEMGITDREYTSADMSDVLAGKLFTENPLVKDVAETLRDRSAQLVGAAIAGAIHEFPEDFPDAEIVIPIDGSFFGKTPGYQEAVEFYATDLLDSKKKIVTKYVKESGMKGAGIAALSLIK